MLKVKAPGFYTTLQDLGRYHFRHYGVPVSGAMDQGALKRANALLENPPEAAALEITMKGPDLEFTAPTFMVLSGAPLEAALDGASLEMDRVYPVSKGAILSCGHVLRGLRTYLAVLGGFRTELRLGSRSFYAPVTLEKTLSRGMELPYIPNSDFEPKLLKIKSKDVLTKKELKVTPGPEFEVLTDRQKAQLFETEFQVAKEYDRMACQLNPPLDGHQEQMITSATQPGTVQLTPVGRLIVLMRDGQTTGGYPRILQLDDDSLDVMGQKRFGDGVRFRWG